MSYNTLTYAVSEGILTLTLNRPDQLNSFTLEMARELVDAFNRASDDDAVGAVVRVAHRYRILYRLDCRVLRFAEPVVPLTMTR